MKYKTLTGAVIVAIGALAWTELAPHARTSAIPLKVVPGTKLRLVAKYEPLHLYIYADTASTNAHPDYLVCEGNDDVVLRENAGSNTVKTTHFEDGFGVLLTKRNEDGRILERTASYNDNSGRTEYTYIDKHGAGEWDVFLDHNRGLFYTRSNLCWVLRNQDDTPPRGNVGRSTN